MYMCIHLGTVRLYNKFNNVSSEQRSENVLQTDTVIYYGMYKPKKQKNLVEYITCMHTQNSGYRLYSIRIIHASRLLDTKRQYMLKHFKSILSQ